MFVFVEINGGSAKATVMTCCCPFIFVAPLFPSPLALCRHFLALLRVVFVRKTAVIFVVLFCPCNSRYLLRVVFVRATDICSSSARMMFLWQLQPFLSVPIFLHHILQSTCRLFCFVFFLLFSSLLFFFSLFLWSGLLCCVLVPGTLGLHLLYFH